MYNYAYSMGRATKTDRKRLCGITLYFLYNLLYDKKQIFKAEEVEK